MTDAERGQQVGEGLRTRVVDGCDEVHRRQLAEALQADEVRHLEVIAVGCIGQEAGRDELSDPLLSETLDVHGTARGEVHNPLDPLCWAVGVDAVGVTLAIETDEATRAARAGLRKAPRL